MGRRLLLILGMMLLALSTAPGVRGQDRGTQAAVRRASPRAGCAGTRFPRISRLPGDRPATDDDPPPLRKTKSTGTTQESRKKKNARRTIRVQPGRRRMARTDVAKPLVDENVVQAQATAPSSGAAASQASASGRSRCRPPIGCRWANSRSPSPSTCRHRRP